MQETVVSIRRVQYSAYVMCCKSIYLTTACIVQVEEELARQRLVTQQTQERLASQKLINIDLKERLNMLERLDLLAFRRESACMIEFQRVHLKETY